MAFVVETGVGLAGANSYQDVDSFKEYHKDRGVVLPSGVSSADIRHALVNGTDFLDRRYRDGFIGIRLNVNQSLEWPRVNAFYRDGRIVSGVPPELRFAVNELALFSLELAVAGTSTGSRTLTPNPSYDDSNRIVTSFSEKVGSISRSKSFADDQVILDWRKYPTIEGLIRELIEADGGRDLKRA